MLMTQDALPARDRHSTRNSVIYYRKPRLFHAGLIETLARIVGLRDPNLQVHSLGVANFASKLARRLGLPKEQVDLIRRGSLLHNVGKLSIAQVILSKSAPLSVKEREMIKTHPFVGAILLSECAEYTPLIPIVLHQHEYFNGQGYPDKIAGDQIEIEARIVCVSEVAASMLSDTPYREALPAGDIINELDSQAGRKYDPCVAETALHVIKEMQAEHGVGCSSISKRVYALP